MGQYALHLRRWLAAFDASQFGVLWLEQFKRSPFTCLHAIERFVGARPHDYRTQATRNRAGLWVVGKSKSSQAGTSQADGGAKARARRGPTKRCTNSTRRGSAGCAASSSGRTQACCRWRSGYCLIAIGDFEKARRFKRMLVMRRGLSLQS